MIIDFIKKKWELIPIYYRGVVFIGIVFLLYIILSQLL